MSMVFSPLYRVDKPLDNVPVLPPELVAQPAKGAVLASRLQPQHSQCLWYYHPLLMVVGWWDALEGLKAFHRGSTAWSFVWNHAADGAPEHLRRGAVVPWSTTLCVVTGLLAKEGLVLYCWICVLVECVRCLYPSERHTFRSEEFAGDIERLATHDYNLLAVEELFGDGAGEAAQKVSFAVHNNLFFSSVQYLFVPCEPKASNTYHRLKRRHLDLGCVKARWC